jgi:hypothetical protein
MVNFFVSTSHLQTINSTAGKDLPTLIMAEYLTRALGHTGCLTGRSIGNAGLLIDLHQIVLISDRAGRAGLDTHLAANATDLADRLDIFPEILGRTGDKNPGLEGLNLNDRFRTGTNAHPATHTFVRVDYREIFYHIDGVKGAGLGTFAQTDTGVLAGRRSAEAEVGGSAGGEPVILVLVADPTFYS